MVTNVAKDPLIRENLIIEEKVLKAV